MGFAHPFSLLFLGLFVPIILLYLLKQRRRRVQVSTLMFWDRILRDEQTVTSMARLKKWLSLLMQLLFVALLALALSQPILSEKLTGARRMVLLIDRSASMTVQEGEQTRFEEALEKAKAVVRGMSMGDTMMVVSFASKPEVICPFSDQKKALLSAIDRLEVTHEGTDLKAALDLLYSLPADERETLAYILSDGAYPAIEIDPPDTIRFAYLPVGKSTRNVGITAFQVRPLPASPRDFQIYMEIRNETEEDLVVLLELRVNEDLVDAYEITLPAYGVVSKSYKQYSAQGEMIQAVVDYADAFMLDNRACSVLAVPDPISVQLVQEENLFLENALRTDDQLTVQAVEPSLYRGSENFEVTVFSDWSPDRTPAGNSIFIHRFPQDLGLETAGEMEKPLISEFERSHPINRHCNFTNITIEKALRIVLSDVFFPLVSSFENPLVLLSEGDKRKVMVVAFDTLSSDLPLRIAFPILISNAIRFMAGREGAGSWKNPALGTVFGLSDLKAWLANERVGDGTSSIFRIIKPGGERLEMKEESVLLFVDRVGVYSMEIGEQKVRPLFAANLVDPHESIIRPSGDLPLHSSKPLPEIKEGFRLGFEPWYFLVGAALWLILVEWVLFHRRMIE